MKNTLLLALLLAFQSLWAQNTFNDNGISFSYPADWAITNNDNSNESVFISCTKQGSSQSGIVYITTVSTDFNLQDITNLYKEEFTKNYKESGLDTKFGNSIEAEFGEYKTLKTHFEGESKYIKIEGDIHVFESGNKTITIMKQGAIEHQTQNKDGFALIEKTFRCD